MIGIEAGGPTLAEDYVNAGWGRSQTILDYFDETVRKSPDRTAIVAAGGVRMTYAELSDRATRVAGALAHIGVTKGDVVSLQLPNIAEFVVIHLAVTRLGAVTNPLLPNYRSKELTYVLGFARTKVAVIVETYRGFDFAEMYEDLWSKLSDLKAVYVIGGPGRGRIRPFEELIEEQKPVPKTEYRGGDITSLIFTSGTEASPKGVVHSHDTMMHSTLTMAKVIGLTSNDVVWMPSPIAHGTGFEWGVRQAITIGGSLVLQDIWDAEEALRLIEAERCSFVLSATPFVTMLLESPSVTKRDLSSLRVFGCAGAPIPRQLGEKARTVIGCTLIGMWGMTECFVGSASRPTDPDDKLWATDGKAMPGGELAVFDTTRTNILPPGNIGELATRGPHVALGYFNDPERSVSTFRSDGWLFSNDLATMDADGYIRLVGRIKDIINRGGLKISVREMEDLLLEHPSISQVALVPVSDDRLGERACACVIPRKGMRVTLLEIVDYLTERGTAKYKLPEFLAVVDELPMTASGKVQRFRLQDDIRSGQIQVSST
jgi:acyl-coenzyme A synthetase/AMP-(fatty) acid ligase